VIYEMRTYRMKVGSVPAYLKLVEEEGIQIQTSRLGELVGYFSSEIGPLNEIVHIWAYADLADRAARRAALAEDPRWQNFMPKIQSLIHTMENKILLPTPFSPLA
jgi:NIPSNAP